MWFAQIESLVSLTRELGGQRVRVSVLELQVGRLHGALQGAKTHMRIDIRAKHQTLITDVQTPTCKQILKHNAG